eukprot:678436-Pelagomonas_calceolata.AAC.3
MEQWSKGTSIYPAAFIVGVVEVFFGGNQRRGRDAAELRRPALDPAHTRQPLHAASDVLNKSIPGTSHFTHEGAALSAMLLERVSKHHMQQLHCCTFAHCAYNAHSCPQQLLAASSDFCTQGCEDIPILTATIPDASAGNGQKHAAGAI